MRCRKLLQQKKRKGSTGGNHSVYSGNIWKHRNEVLKMVKVLAGTCVDTDGVISRKTPRQPRVAYYSSNEPGRLVCWTRGLWNRAIGDCWNVCNEYHRLGAKRKGFGRSLSTKERFSLLFINWPPETKCRLSLQLVSIILQGCTNRLQSSRSGILTVRRQ